MKHSCWFGLCGEVAEWLKAVVRKDGYAAQKVASEVRILPLSAIPDSNEAR